MAGRRVCVSAFFRSAKPRICRNTLRISKMSEKPMGKGGDPNRNGFDSRQPTGRKKSPFGLRVQQTSSCRHGIKLFSRNFPAEIRIIEKRQVSWLEINLLCPSSRTGINRSSDIMSIRHSYSREGCCGFSPHSLLILRKGGTAFLLTDMILAYF